MPDVAPMPPARPEALDRCTFEHKLFGRLGDVLFRAAETDGAPVLVIPLGRGVAALPLRSLQAELKIEAASHDGQMLVLVARSLDFVTDLRLGDALPFEVLDGGASWQPKALHQQVAAARLKLRLVAQLLEDQPGSLDEAGAGCRGEGWNKAEPQAVLAAADEPGMANRLHAAHLKAASALGLADAAAAARRIEEAAHELGFIEALRERLLRRVVRLVDRFQHLARSVAQNLAGLELLSRVKRLTSLAIDKIGGRFAELDAETGVVLDLLGDLDARRPILRRHRDWLYCSLRAWEAILAAWEAAGADWAAGTWPLLSRTYRFLAPRFMPMQEWQSATRFTPEDRALGPRLVW